MKIAFILYDGLTMLDFVGIYDPLTRLQKYLPDLSIETCGFSKKVADSFGLITEVDHVQNNLSVYDVIIIPGGFGTRALINDEQFMLWIKSAESVALKTSICTGSLILGASGYLQGKIATTHFDEYDQLSNYGCQVVKERVVDDGNIITAGAVASSLDLGLYLCEKWAGAEAAKWISGRMDYNV